MTRPTKRPRVNHQETADRLKANPHTWLIVGEYRSTISADGICRYIRTGAQRHSHRTPSPYQPAGAYEARMELTEFGVRVDARYVGTPRKDTPVMNDATRVLGQIKRGEILAGPEAARRIAARHQAAYGDAVWGPKKETNPVPAQEPSADAAWAEALAGLGGAA